MILVLASLPVHSLILVVYVFVVVWGCVLYACESLKCEGGAMVVMVPRQYFQVSNFRGPAVQRSLGNTIFASCRSICCVSRFLVGLAAVPQSGSRICHVFTTYKEL